MSNTDSDGNKCEVADKKPNLRHQRTLEKRQALIVKKASKLFMKKGYAQTSMRDIAKATGINLGNLYYYISSKEDILCLAFNAYHKVMMDMLGLKGLLAIEDPRAQLKAVVRQALETTYDVRDDILMMYRETGVLPRSFLKTVLEKEDAFIRLIEGLIARGVEQGAFKVRDPFFAANMLVMQLSLYSLRRWNLKRYTRQEYLDLAEETILRAIMPEDAPEQGPEDAAEAD